MFLERIIAAKMDELQKRQETIPMSELKAAIEEKPPPLDFGAALSGGSLRLIAEVKKASPSRGVLSANLDVVKVAMTYARCGAAAISVLTETQYFQGSLGDLEAIRHALPRMPLLRKDFIINPYQVFESRACKADALLLIVAILDDSVLKRLLALSYDLGMQCLVEIHNEIELKRALAVDARIIGINNRNLDTMEVDLGTTQRLRPLIPPDLIVVSESGIKERVDIQKLGEWRADAVLIGEALVTAPDTASRIKELF
jgi:indole-3-glycerol phosphate synthase